MAPCKASRTASQPFFDLVDDGRRHLLIGGLGDQARRVGRGRHRHGEFGAGLARHFDEAAERGVGAFRVLDGGRAAQGAGAGKGLDGGGERRERIGLVHHHRHYELLAPPFPLRYCLSP